jgi:hypothetical protein
LTIIFNLHHSPTDKLQADRISNSVFDDSPTLGIEMPIGGAVALSSEFT